MPRMSVDSKFGRDPRVLRLAKACGWSRRETMGALFDVWEVCYERVSEVLEAADVDAAAELDGFAANLIDCGLGRARKRGVLIAGAKDRIKYLKDSREAGRKGGLKSGESRRNSMKRPFKGGLPDPSQKSNPPDLVPDSAPDSPSSTSPERETDEHEPSLSGLPDGWIPEQTDAFRFAEKHAASKGLDVAIELIKFGAHARSCSWERSDWTQAFVKWLLDARPARAAPARAAPVSAPPKLRVVDPPVEVVPMTPDDAAELAQLAHAIAANADTAAENERRREGATRGVQEASPRSDAKEATG